MGNYINFNYYLLPMLTANKFNHFISIKCNQKSYYNLNKARHQQKVKEDHATNSTAKAGARLVSE